MIDSKVQKAMIFKSTSDFVRIRKEIIQDIDTVLNAELPVFQT